MAHGEKLLSTPDLVLVTGFAGIPLCIWLDASLRVTTGDAEACHVLGGSLDFGKGRGVGKANFPALGADPYLLHGVFLLDVVLSWRCSVSCYSSIIMLSREKSNSFLDETSLRDQLMNFSFDTFECFYLFG